MKTGTKLFGRMAAVPPTAAAAMTMGAIAGGCVSLVQNSYRVSRGGLSADEAALNVAKDTVGTGLAAAAGAALVTVLGIGGLAGVIGFMTVSGLSKGLWDTAVFGVRRRQLEPPA